MSKMVSELTKFYINKKKLASEQFFKTIKWIGMEENGSNGIFLGLPEHVMLNDLKNTLNHLKNKYLWTDILWTENLSPQIRSKLIIIELSLVLSWLSCTWTYLQSPNHLQHYKWPTYLPTRHIIQAYRRCAINKGIVSFRNCEVVGGPWILRCG